MKTRIGFSMNPVMTLTGKTKNFDGIGQYTNNLITALQKKNYNIQQIYSRELKELFVHRCTHHPYSHHVVENPLFSHFIPFNFYTSIEKAIDLLHITNHLVPKLKNTPVVATIHDASMQKHPNWFGKRAWLKSLLFKNSAKYADHVVTVSNAARSDIMQYWKIPEEKISVAYPGVSKAWFEKISEETSNQILKHYQINYPYLLFVGTFQQKKNIERVIDAYLQLPKQHQSTFKLIIIGKIHPGLTKPSLLKKIQRLQEKQLIHWLQYISFDHLRCLLQNAQLLLFPSLEEGFGSPIVEAFASKTPVVTSNIGATAEVAGNAAYLIDPYDTNHITQAMQEIADDKGLKQNMITKGLERAKNFTWENCANEVIKIYQTLL